MQNNKKNQVLLCTHKTCEKPQTADGEYCTKHYPKANQIDITKSEKLQNKLLSLVNKKYKKVASSLLTKIINIEIEIENNCNQ